MKKIFIRNYYFVIKLSTDFILYEGDFGVRVESVFHIGKKIFAGKIISIQSPPNLISHQVLDKQVNNL